MAFVTAKAAIDTYWSDDTFEKEVQRKGRYVEGRLSDIVEKYGEGNFTTRGRGMFQGINCVNGDIAGQITHAAFRQGLIIETSGADDQVIKLLCPLIISDENLTKGIDILEEAVRMVCRRVDEIPEENDYFDDVTVASTDVEG